MSTATAEPMTPEEIEEEFWKCKASPLYFIRNYVKIKDPDGNVVVMKNLNFFQKAIYAALKKRYFKAYKRIKGKIYKRFRRIRLLLVKPRQVGASTLIIALILHDTLFWSGTETAIFLHKDEYSKKMLARLKQMLELLPAWLKPPLGGPKDLDSKSEIYFSQTQARISVGTPGKSEELSGDKGRSETLHNVLISEMPRYTHQAEFMQGISAAARFGNQFIESTPLKIGDLFHSLFSKSRKGENDWMSLFFPWYDDPRNKLELTTIDSVSEAIHIAETLSPNERILVDRFPDKVTLGHIKWRRHTITNMYNGDERRFMQEYAEDPETCFMGSGFNYFDDPEFEIKRITIIPTPPPRAIYYKPPIPGHFYIHSVDAAKGLGGDADSSVIHISDFETAEQVAEYASNTLSDKLLPFKVHEHWLMYPGMIAVEGNNIGEGVMAIFRSHPAFAKDLLLQWMLWRHSKTQDGFYTSYSNKPIMVSNLYTALKLAVKTYLIEQQTPLEPAGYRIGSEGLVLELGTFLDLGNDKYGAEDGSGNHDDRVLAAMINLAVRKHAASYRAKFFELLEEMDLTWETFRERKLVSV